MVYVRLQVARQELKWRFSRAPTRKTEVYNKQLKVAVIMLKGEIGSQKAAYSTQKIVTKALLAVDGVYDRRGSAPGMKGVVRRMQEVVCCLQNGVQYARVVVNSIQEEEPYQQNVVPRMVKMLRHMQRCFEGMV